MLKRLVAQFQTPFKLRVTCDKGPLPPERKHRTEGGAEANPRRNSQKLFGLHFGGDHHRGNEGPIIPLRSHHDSREHDWMDETAKRTEPQTGDAAADSDAATVAETVARNAGSVVGAVASKVSGSHTPSNDEKRTQAARSEQSKPNVDAYAKEDLRLRRKRRPHTAGGSKRRTPRASIQ